MNRSATRLFPGAWNMVKSAAFGSALLVIAATHTARAGVNVWTSLGPRVTAPTGVNTVAIDPVVPTTVYVGTNVGVLKSTDGGNSWGGTGLTTAVGVLVLDPVTEGTLYAIAAGSVVKSVDGGATWAGTGLASNQPVAVLVIDPVTPSTVYAGTSGEGIFKSTDAGKTWVAANTGLTNLFVRAVAIDPVTHGTLYTGTDYGDGGVFKSTDGGGTWNLLVNFTVDLLTVDPNTPNTLYAEIDNGCPRFCFDTLVRSRDGGATWGTLRTSAVPAIGLHRALAIDPVTARTLYWNGGIGQGVLKSTDSGDSWGVANNGLGNALVTAFAIDPHDPSTVYAAAGGLFRSTNGGGVWVAVDLSPYISPVAGEPISTIAIAPHGTGTVYAAHRDRNIMFVLTQTDAGDFWGELGPPTIVARLIIASDYRDTLYGASAVGDGVVKSADGGASWQFRNNGLVARGGFTSADALAVDPRAPTRLFAGTEGGVFKTEDGGGIWTHVLDGPWIFDFAIDPVTPSTLYAGSSASVFKSTDGGGTWSASDIFASDIPLWALAVDPNSNATVYAASPTDVFKSTNGGSTWTAFSRGLPAASAATFDPVRTLAVDPVTPDTLYVGTEGHGVFKSTDGAASWSTFNTGMTDRTVYELAFDPQAPSRLYAATDAGVFDIEVVTPVPAAVNISLLANAACDNGDRTASTAVSALVTSSGGGAVNDGIRVAFRASPGGGNRATPGQFSITSPGFTGQAAPCSLSCLSIVPQAGRALACVLFSKDQHDKTITVTASANNGSVATSATIALPNLISPPVTATPAPTPRETPVACVGDCNDDHAVTVDEVITLVNIALGERWSCPSGLAAGATVDVSLLVQAVNDALGGCGN